MTDRLPRSLCVRLASLALLSVCAVFVAGCSDEKKDRDKGKDMAKDKAKDERSSREVDVEEERRASGPGTPPPPPPPPGEAGGDREKKSGKEKESREEPKDGREPSRIEGQSGGSGKKALDKDKKMLPSKDDARLDVEKKPDEKKPKLPTVWKREDARKTFARVYVGDGNALDLVSIHVSVIVEGPRARTVVDHVFRNPHNRVLEGTFEYPLPAGASPSYYAMFLGASRETPPSRFKPRGENQGQLMTPESMPPAQLARQIDAADWGRLQEAKIVAPEKAVEAYEEVVRGRVDPALLEYASGNTFRGRVFPIAAKGYNRVIVAYEETLPVSDGKLFYRFDLPATKFDEMRVSLQFDPREGKDPTFAPKDARKQAGSERTSFTHTWSDTTPKGEVLFTLSPKNAAVQATSGKLDKGPTYLYARLRPDLPKADEKPFGKHAVFLLDTSVSEAPDRFGVSMKLLKQILENDDSIKHFNILCFNAGAAWVAPKGWLDNTAAGREKMLAALDGILLEGATDLAAALEKIVTPDWAIDKDTPLSCFLLSDGHLTWGETDVAPLVARFRKRCSNPTRFFCYRTGLGEENAELFDALTQTGGSTFQCFGEAEIAAAAKAHRRQCMTITKVVFDGAGSLRELLVAGRRAAVYPGGELIVTGHSDKLGKGKIVVEGEFAGKAFTQSFDVDVNDAGELAARGWAEVAVASLLALNDPWMEPLITAYCQQFNVASRAASFLVLENEGDYKRLNLEDEKEKTLKGDLGKYVDGAWAALSKEPSLKQQFGRLLMQVNGRTNVLAGDDSPVRKMLALLSEEDCNLPPAAVRGAILKEKDADGNYLGVLKRDRRNVHGYVAESQRRSNDNDVDGAVRALSGVMEEYAGRGDALRLVGYRLLDLRQPSQASWLFARVLRQRPFEPHSFRDLARSLEDADRHALAALMYECVLAGKWHGRFVPELKTVTKEDHARLLRAGLRDGNLTKEQRAYFTKRLDEVSSRDQTAELRVSITWNTDNTDVDLHVVEPNGEKVFYGKPTSGNGGTLSQDQREGYGPERYQIAKAKKGEYKILVHYFRANRNLLGGETHVHVTVTRNAGTDREKVERFTAVLRRQDEMIEVTRVRQ